MSFAFKHRKNVPAQVRAVARAQIEKALEAASGQPEQIEDTVHELRRSCKKLRGLVRLIAPDFKDAKKENAAFRDAARSLSQARDVAVMGETFTQLLDFDRNNGDARIGKVEAEDVAVALAQQSRRAQANGGDQFGQFCKIFTKARDRVEDWSFQSHRFDVIGDGLTQNYRQFRKRMAAAEDDPKPENFHEWRKVAKYHGHHVSLFRRTAPDMLKGRQAALDRLGDLLGDHHNLAVLEETLLNLGIPGSAAVVLRDWQEEMAKAALSLGQQLGAEKPEALRDRFESYWKLLPE